MKKNGILTALLLLWGLLLFTVPARGAAVGSVAVEKVTNEKSGVRITWKEAVNVEGYKVFRREGESAWKWVKTINDKSVLTCTDTKAENGKLYYYTVRGFIGSRLGSYNKTGLPIFRLRKPNGIGSIASNAAGAVTLTWPKNGAATGTQVAYSRNKSFSDAARVKILGSKSSSVTINNLEQGKTYYFKVQYYRTVGKKNYFSSFSTVKRVDVKKENDKDLIRSAYYELGSRYLGTAGVVFSVYDMDGNGIPEFFAGTGNYHHPDTLQPGSALDVYTYRSGAAVYIGEMLYENLSSKGKQVLSANGEGGYILYELRGGYLALVRDVSYALSGTQSVIYFYFYENELPNFREISMSGRIKAKEQLAEYLLTMI